MLATGLFAFGPLTATPAHPEGVYVGGAALLGVQALGVLVALAYCGGATWVLLKLTDLLVGLRVTREEEREGLDVVLHGEQVF